jgi:hypothetical protein
MARLKEGDPKVGNSGMPAEQVMSQFEKGILTTIKIRMEGNGIHSHDASLTSLQWCKPQHHDGDIWHDILDKPLFTPPSKLSKVLDIRNVPCTWSSRPTGFTSFYIRTLVFRTCQLLEVLDKTMAMGYSDHRQVEDWVRQLKLVHPSTEVYVRYVGKTEYSPWHRFWHDLPISYGSFAIRFDQATLLLHPKIIQDVLVQEVYNARLDNANNSIANAAEQGIIALLHVGYRTLI